MLGPMTYGALSQAVTAAFSPSDIAGLQLWLTADTDYLKQDAAGSTAVTSVNDPVGYWQDRSGNSRNFTQSTTSKKPTYQTAINGKGTVRTDGVDDLLVHAANFASDTQGTLAVVYRLTATLKNFQAIFSSMDEATAAATGFFFEAYKDGPVRTWQRNAGDTIDEVRGGTTLSASVDYLTVARSSGSAYTIRLNGTTESLTVSSGTNSGDWLGDSVGRDSFAVGAIKYNAEGNFLKADIRQILLYDSNLTGTDLSNLESYLADDAGITL